MTKIVTLGEHQYALKHWVLSGIRNAVLVHFDTHHDCCSCDGRYDDLLNLDAAALDDRITKELFPSDFIAPAVYSGIIDEIYWVIPSWAGKGTAYYDRYWTKIPLFKKKEFYSEKTKKMLSSGKFKDEWSSIQELSNSYLYGSPEDVVDMYVTADESGIDFLPSALAPGGTVIQGAKRIKLHKVYAKDLPHLSKDVILDFDADYFSPSGFDTFDEEIKKRKLSQIKADIKSCAEEIKRAGISPAIVTIAGSPDYTCTSDMSVIPALIESSLVSSGVLERGVVSEKDKWSYDANTIIIASALLDKANSDIGSDPRRLGGGQEEVRQYLNSEAEIEIVRLDMPLYEPDIEKQLFTTEMRKFKRNDYSYFIKECEKHGLDEMLYRIKKFIVLFQDVSVLFDPLNAVYSELAGYLKGILANPGTLYRSISRFIEITKEYHGVNRDLARKAAALDPGNVIDREYQNKIRNMAPKNAQESEDLMRRIINGEKF